MIETIIEQMVKRNKMKQLVTLATDKSCIRRNLERRSEAQLYYLFFNRKFVQVVGKVKSNDEIEAHYMVPGDDN